MTNLAALVGDAPIDETLEAFIARPEGFTNGNGDQLEMQMHPANGTRYRKESRKMQIKYSNRPTPENLDEEAKLDLQGAQSAEYTAELLARCCDGWNIMDPDPPKDGDGKKPKGAQPVDFNIKNGTELLTAAEGLRSELDRIMTSEGNEQQAKRKA